jgi:Xaa-Pro aminopeptidase
VNAEEFATRRSRLASRLTQAKIDALIISAMPNVRYLTGFTGSNALVLAAPSETILFTDPRYAIQAAQQTGCKVAVARGPLYPALMRAAARRKLRRLGFEKSRLRYEGFESLQETLPLGGSLRPVEAMVESLRMVKSPAEIELIRRSVKINSDAFEAALKKARIGMKESELAAEIEYQMRLLGAEKPAFDSIVAAGERSALPHAEPGADSLRSNQLLLIDIGATVDGYASDMTRVAFLGRPGRKIRSLYRAVLEAQLAGIDAVRPGISAGKVDTAARRVLRSYGFDKAFVHSTGHGLGLEIHEPPRLGKGDSTALETGMAITVEPGAYLEGFGGVRIEDTVVVTSTGCEVLTPTSKELFLLS